jgi:hypothetical protein
LGLGSLVESSCDRLDVLQRSPGLLRSPLPLLRLGLFVLHAEIKGHMVPRSDHVERAA